jgi:hypothetical protein
MSFSSAHVVTTALTADSKGNDFKPSIDEVKSIIQQFKAVYAKPLKDIIVNYLRHDNTESFDQNLETRFFKLRNYYRHMARRDFIQQIENPNSKFADKRLVKVHHDVQTIIEFQKKLEAKKELLNARETRFLAECYVLRNGDESNEALQLFIKAGEKLNDLGSLIRAAELDTERTQALTTQLSAETQEHPAANYFMGKNARNGNESLAYSTLAANSGYIDALRDMGRYYSENRDRIFGYNKAPNVTKDNKKSYQFYAQAAQRGNGASLSSIGERLMFDNSAEWCVGLYCLYLAIEAGSKDPICWILNSNLRQISKEDGYFDFLYYFTISMIPDFPGSSFVYFKPVENENRAELYSYIETSFYCWFNKSLAQADNQPMMDLISHNPEFLPIVYQILTSDNLNKIMGLNKTRYAAMQAALFKEVPTERGDVERVSKFPGGILDIITEQTDAAAAITKMDAQYKKSIAQDIVRSIVDKAVDCTAVSTALKFK